MSNLYNSKRIIEKAGHRDFEFDYSYNVILYKGSVISLSPHESDILRVLLDNRARPTSIGVLIQQVYGASEPDAAAASIRVAIHSLRKKILSTGMLIRSEAKIGYEIDASEVPELNRRLHDRILLALNVAREKGENEIAALLQAALTLAEARRRKWVPRLARDLSLVGAELTSCAA